MKIDTGFNMYSDAGGEDPDITSPTLKSSVPKKNNQQSTKQQKRCSEKNRAHSQKCEMTTTTTQNKIVE